MDSNINYIPQIDYTSRDYTAIREDLIALIDQFTPEWTNRDPVDLGMTLVELFSYLGDIINFYTDRAANEGFLATASQRDSLLKIAQMIGYVPTSISAAVTDITFSNSTPDPVTIPARTQIATTSVVNGLNTQIVFETDAAVTVPGESGGVDGTNTVSATQGVTTVDKVLGISSGAPSQVFRISDVGVVISSIEIVVNNVNYNYSAFLLDNTIYDPVFTTVNDAEGYTYVVFGDGVGGRIPPAASSIYATYRVSDGSIGNVPAQTLTTFLTNVEAGVTAYNSAAASGGADEESSDSIRFNAPRALRTLTRAVSLKDYTYLALQVPGVAKANADSSNYNSVTLYLAPFGDTGLVGGNPTSAFNALAAKVGTYFVDKTPPSTTLTILPPTYVDVDLEMTVHVLPQYQQSIITSKALAAVKDLFTLENSFFADVLPVQYLLNAVSAVPGVDYATIELFRKTSTQQSFSVSSWARSSNIVTLTTTVTHNITVGQTVKVTDIATGVNGTVVVSAVTSNTVSFGNVGGNVSSTSVTGNVKALVVETVTCAVNEIPAEGTFTLTAVGGIQ